MNAPFRIFRSFAPLVLVVATLAAASARAGTTSFTYDASGRLQGTRFESGRLLKHDFDAAGNLVSLTISTNAIAVQDSDNDGMDDAWEMLHFGNLARNGLEDFDGDSANDLAEFLAGTLPKSSASVLRVSTLVPGGTGATIEWLAVAGKKYRIQFKNGLNDPGWTDLAGEVTAAGATASKADAAAAGRTARFYRVLLIE